MLGVTVGLLGPRGGQTPLTTSLPYVPAISSDTHPSHPPTTIPSAAIHTTPDPCGKIYRKDPPTSHCDKSLPHPEASVRVQNVSCSQVAKTDLPPNTNMKQFKTKATIGILLTIITYMSANSVYKSVHPEAFVWQDEDWEESSWIATSKSWMDRKACRWISVCGGAHMHFTRHATQQALPQMVLKDDTQEYETQEWENIQAETTDRPEDWSSEDKVLREIPDYVLEYAPLVHLFSGEQYWPSDIADHLNHVTPALNYTPIQSKSLHAKLDNLGELNQYQRGRFVFMTSNDNVEERPDWLTSEKNIPSLPESMKDDFSGNDGWVHHPGRTYLRGLQNSIDEIKEWFGAGHTFDSDEDLKESAATREQARLLKQSAMEFHRELKRQLENQDEPDEHRVRGGRSDAPAVLIAINKGNGVVDAFWFFFYSFNLGNTVFNIRFGNHVGDWEHTAIRFHNGTPKAVFFSEHNFGSVYSYDAVEKIGKRPVIYSAVGTHAMYATSGLHPYVLPWGILHDQTDRGPLWDPSLNAHTFTYDYKKDILRSSNLTPDSPTSWFHFAGHWGDKFYPLGDKRQYRFAGQYHYVNGPLGPKFKNLGRKKICGGPDSQPCVIKQYLSEEIKPARLQPKGPEADLYSVQEKISRAQE